MKYYLSLFVLGIILGSCGSDDIDAPDCVNTMIQQFETEACSGGDVTVWSFRNETVYCFNYGACQPDRFIDIFTEDCSLLCQLNGPDLITICDGSEWTQFSSLQETLIVIQ